MSAPVKAMESVPSRPAWNLADLNAPFPTMILTCLVAILCYEAARIAYALRVPPHHVAPFWVATPLLVAVLLLVRRRIWPVLIAASLAAMVLGDYKNGV